MCQTLGKQRMPGRPTPQDTETQLKAYFKRPTFQPAPMISKQKSAHPGPSSWSPGLCFLAPFQSMIRAVPEEHS